MSGRRKSLPGCPLAPVTLPPSPALLRRPPEASASMAAEQPGQAGRAVLCRKKQKSLLSAPLPAFFLSFLIIPLSPITALYNEKAGVNERKRKRRTTIRYAFEILKVTGGRKKIFY